MARYRFQNTYSPIKALVVSSNVGHAKIDRDFLKSLRMRMPNVATHSKHAFSMLEKEGADFILCDDHLDDMSGVAFLKKLRTHPRFKHVAVIMVSTKREKRSVVSAIVAGCSGYLLRPYSHETFARQLRLAQHINQFGFEERLRLRLAEQARIEGRADAAIRDFERVTSRPDYAKRYFESGMVHLAKSEYDKAISLFARAVKVNDLFSEAYLGLAKAWQAKGNAEKSRLYAAKAAFACARQRRFQLLKEQFVELMGKEGLDFNPFLALGRRLIRDKDYTAAVTALEHAAELAPENDEIHVELARACHLNRNPEKARTAVANALSVNPGNETARIMHKRLTGEDFAPRVHFEHLERSEEDHDVVMPFGLRIAMMVAGVLTESLYRLRPRLFA
ncbi:response regulator [Desulfovibrio inopinatus]|uniref:response regulator n=1 Tax=Desulfovibrio inopinatus TaxID=102109 RepID=UPI00041728E4|nr:response regulator [Desulfovibrio inopinatus]